MVDTKRGTELVDFLVLLLVGNAARKILFVCDDATKREVLAEEERVWALRTSCIAWAPCLTRRGRLDFRIASGGSSQARLAYRAGNASTTVAGKREPTSRSLTRRKDSGGFRRFVERVKHSGSYSVPCFLGIRDWTLKVWRSVNRLRARRKGRMDLSDLSAGPL
jgi:hypothetical protein